MTVYTLFSGSGGNCIYVRSGKDAILIDAGKSAKQVTSALIKVGADISDIKAIFVTHEHSDHIAGIEILSKKYHIPVHAAEKSSARIMRGTYSSSVCCAHKPLYSCDIGDLHIESFQAPHDSEMNVGYKITSCETSVGIVTDIGCVTNEVRNALTGCENVIIESNHDENMLRYGSYPYDLKQRIFSKYGHLSNNDCANFAVELAKNGTKRILLAHISHENNTEELAYTTTRNQLDAEHYNDVYLAAARQDEPILLISPEMDCEYENIMWRERYMARKPIRARVKSEQGFSQTIEQTS